MNYSKYVHASKEDDTIEYQTLAITSDEPDGFEQALASYGFVENELRKLMGRVLTIVDASIADKEQKKAVKDLIRKEWADEWSFVGEMMCDQKRIQEAYEEYLEENGGKAGEPISLEEALGA